MYYNDSHCSIVSIISIYVKGLGAGRFLAYVIGMIVGMEVKISSKDIIISGLLAAFAFVWRFICCTSLVSLSELYTYVFLGFGCPFIVFFLSYLLEQYFVKNLKTI